MTNIMTGGCVCGALRYRAEGTPLVQGLCHCRTCQRVTGSGHVGFMAFPEQAVAIEGAQQVYSVIGGSGGMATRHACPACGSLVFGRAQVMPGLVNLYAGSLDDFAQFKPEIAIFTRSRAAWDTSSSGLRCFETVPAL
jgi:hypothetical protein